MVEFKEVLVLLTIVITGNSLKADPIRIRRLWGKEYSEAVSARNRADRMRADLEKTLSAARRGTGSVAKTNQTQSDVETATVVRAYQEIISRYRYTEIAAASALSLSGFYQYLGQFDKAAEISAQTAKELAGTHEGAKAAFNTGLIHAQARHQPAEAIEWFARIPKPAKRSGPLYDEKDKLYLAAQQQLIKCELILNNDAQAKEARTR